MGRVCTRPPVEVWLYSDLAHDELASDCQTRTLSTELALELGRAADLPFTSAAVNVARRFLDRIVGMNAKRMREELFEEKLLTFLRRRCQKVGQLAQAEAVRRGESSISETSLQSAIEADIAYVDRKMAAA